MKDKIEWLKMIGAVTIFVAFLAIFPVLGIIFPDIVVEGNAVEAIKGVLVAGSLVIIPMLGALI